MKFLFGFIVGLFVGVLLTCCVNVAKDEEEE